MSQGIETNLIGARTLLVAPGLTTSNKKLLVTKGTASNGGIGREPNVAIGHFQWI